MMRWLIYSFSVGFLLPHFALAENVTHVEPFTYVEHTASQEQVDLLQQTLHINFPPSVDTVGKAIAHVLRPSGYQWVDMPFHEAFIALKDKPLPIAHRRLGPMTLNDALQVLVGSAFILVIDPVYRLIDVRLREEFLPLYDNKEQMPW